MKITIYELLGLIRDKKIKDKTKFRITWWGISESCYRDFYYDADEENELDCLKNVSDDYPLQDAIKLNDEVEIIEEYNTNCELPQSDYSSSLFNKKIEKLVLSKCDVWTGKTDTDLIVDKINEIINVLNKGENKKWK